MVGSSGRRKRSAVTRNPSGRQTDLRGEGPKNSRQKKGGKRTLRTNANPTRYGK
mgnify:CR=1 FL=1